LSVFFYCAGHLRDLHSFPTRRSSDLNTMHEVWDHPQLKARERWREVGSSVGPLPAMLPPGTWNDGPRMDPVPALGEHTDAILARSEEHTSELQSRSDLVCRLLLEKKK